MDRLKPTSEQHTAGTTCASQAHTGRRSHIITQRSTVARAEPHESRQGKTVTDRRYVASTWMCCMEWGIMYVAVNGLFVAFRVMHAMLGGVRVTCMFGFRRLS